MAAFIGANDVLTWVKDASEVAFNLSDACEDAGPGFDSISRDVDKLEKAFRTVRRDSKIEGSPFCLGIPQHRVDFEQVIQDCHRSFQVLDRILQRNALFDDVSQDSIDPLAQVSQELRSHTTKLKEVHRRTKIVSVEILYVQLGTLIRDIQSGIRDPHVLGRIVNLDALSREIERNPSNALLSPNETKPLDFPPRLQIPQSTIHEINTPCTTPGSHSPLVPAQLDESKPLELPSQVQTPQASVQQIDSTHSPPLAPQNLPSPDVPPKEKFCNYHPPTVEDCDDGDEDTPVDLFRSEQADPQRQPNSSTEPTSQALTPPSSNPSDAAADSAVDSTIQTPPPSKDVDSGPPNRTDTDLLRTDEDKNDIREEIKKYKDRIQELEQQQELENFRDFCRRWSAEDALGLQQETRPLPDPKWRTFFVKPSGKIVEKGGGCPCRDCKSKGRSHHEQRPTPVRRTSTMDSFNSFHDPRSPRRSPSDTDLHGHTTGPSKPKRQNTFRYEPTTSGSEPERQTTFGYEPAATSSARYAPSSYGATGSGSSGYLPTTYESPGYESWNNPTNSFVLPSIGSRGYGSSTFSPSAYNPTHLEPPSYGNFGPYSQEPSSYSYSTSNPNFYNPSAASSYDSYDYPHPQHRAPFTDTTNAMAAEPRYIPSTTSTDNSSIQPFFNVSPRSSALSTPIPSPANATPESSPLSIPTAPAKGKDVFNDSVDSWQPDHKPRHRHRGHRSRNAEPDSIDRSRYPPPLPPKDIDAGTRNGRSAGTGDRRGTMWGTFRR